jgi:hypothetical protein
VTWSVLIRALAGTAVAMAAVVLAGCGSFGRQGLTEVSEQEANVYPANYKREMLAFLHTYLNDPTNVRDAAITEPILRPIASRNRYVVCVRFNAKDSSGRYGGIKNGMASFLRGRFDQFVEQTRESTEQVRNACAQAEFARFPELEAMVR